MTTEQEPTAMITLHLRSRADQPDGSGRPTTSIRAVEADRTVEAGRTSMIICDMWDQHWSRGATERTALLAPRIDALATLLRSRGALIVHAPSDTMSFYQDHPARLTARRTARLDPPARQRTGTEPPLPIDDSDGGSDTGETDQSPAWTRQHTAITIDPSDVISDDGDEVYSVLTARGISTVLMVGVHTNMCILNRSFAIKSLVQWGFSVVLVRDLTDAMYNPAMPPYVDHQRGTELVVEHIEKYWCPTTLSTQL